MRLVVAYVRRFFHCLVWTFTLKDHRMETWWNENGTIAVGCTCGKLFYCRPFTIDKKTGEWV